MPGGRCLRLAVAILGCAAAGCSTIFGFEHGELVGDAASDADATPEGASGGDVAGLPEVSEAGHDSLGDLGTDLHPDPSLCQYFKGHCYYKTVLSTSWALARAECIRTGAHLVTMSSQEEQDFALTVAGGAD